jgi:transcriptional regulator GlxA family with amidase domain
VRILPQNIKHIVIAGFDGALATAITGLMDIFSLVGVSWQRIMSDEPDPRFKVWLASENKLSIQCINRLKLEAHISFDELMGNQVLNENLFAIIVPTIGSRIDSTLSNNPKLLELLRWANEQNHMIAGNCTGNFFLAEAGVLDGLTATTHWGYQDQFEQRYPSVNLRINQLITSDKNIYCAGGGLAWFDLCIYMIEQEFGYDIAVQTAKSFVIDYRRDNQQSYSLTRLKHQHQDELIAKIQSYVEDHIENNEDLCSLAQKFNISRRTLIRRFNQALGLTPHAYLQNIRIEYAQKLLSESDLSAEQIVQKVGYEDLSSFRRLFKKHTGSTLSEYRRRFAKRV